MTELGRLEKVDLRNAWATEAGDFTPWLAGEENIRLLSETVGLELEVQATEKEVGSFRADILCKDVATDQWVLIENQLEGTDHTHLGQLLTYAAGLDAVTIIWIAERFTAEHRAALDWVNNVTREGVGFFGLEIELWRIGDSPFAPKFNIVCKPNEWSRAVKTTTESTGPWLEFWSAFRDYVESQGNPVKCRQPGRTGWMSFAVGRSNTGLYAGYNRTDALWTVGLYLTGESREEFFQQLLKRKDGVEHELGFELVWGFPDMKDKYISVRAPGIEPSAREQWGEQHEWLLLKLIMMDKVFRPCIAALRAPGEPESTDA